MRFLIDECLHTSLVDVANAHGHESHHVNWLGQSGAADHALIKVVIDGDFTFVTNNAVDFRRLYCRQRLHAGLVILVPHAVPERQRALFHSLLAALDPSETFLNEVVEIDMKGETMLVTRYDLPRGDD